MNDRKELINAIATGNVERLKRLRKKGHPVLISAPSNGKYYNYSEKKEISLAEIEELKKDRTVIFLTQAEGSVTSDICTSEQEIIDRMRRDGEID